MAPPGVLLPASVEDIVETVMAAQRDGRVLVPYGGGSKGEIGRSTPDALRLDMRAFAGVVDYDPAELVLTVGAGMPLRDVNELVRSEKQMLAFDPFDHGPLLGRVDGAATIGGIVAAGVVGSRRLSAGGVRDHLLGFRAVTGRGESILAGARVVKNVTGYDLPKLAAGSWGRLFAMTEVTLKVLPRPQVQATWVVHGLNPRDAASAMARAMSGQAEVAAAAHLPTTSAVADSRTALRLEGFGKSVMARGEMLRALLKPFGPASMLDEDAAMSLWSDLRTLSTLDPASPLWRVNVPPSRGPDVVAQLEPEGAGWLFDWAGGLVWLSYDGAPERVRLVASNAGGHAMLVRGRAHFESGVPCFHPPAKGVGALEARIRRAFDPEGVFESGRFGDRQ